MTPGCMTTNAVGCHGRALLGRVLHIHLMRFAANNVITVAPHG